MRIVRSASCVFALTKTETNEPKKDEPRPNTRNRRGGGGSGGGGGGRNRGGNGGKQGGGDAKKDEPKKDDKQADKPAESLDTPAEPATRPVSSGRDLPEGEQTS